MKFRAERDALTEALALVARAVARGASLPVLSGIRLALSGDKLELTGSDLQLTIQNTIPVSGSADGVTVVPARLVADVVRSMEPGAITFELADEHQVAISAGRTRFTINPLPHEEYPQHPDPLGEEVTVGAAALREAIRQVAPAASTDELRPVLTAVLLEADSGSLRMVATDSYRLAVREMRGAQLLAEGQQVLVPSRALTELQRVIGDTESVRMRLGGRDASFTTGSVRLVTQLVEGQFPNYRNLIPTSQPNELTVAREALAEAVSRVRLMAADAIRLKMSPDGLELIGIDPEVGEAHEELDATFSGEELTVAFNPAYLLDGVNATVGDEVTIQTSSPFQPAVIRGADDDSFLYLLMPVRVASG